MHPLRVALAGFIDYAGLFPPASLDLERTAANHRRYAASPEAWLLGRLIVPAERLDQLSTLLLPSSGDATRAWTVSALIRAASLGRISPRSIGSTPVSRHASPSSAWKPLGHRRLT